MDFWNARRLTIRDSDWVDVKSDKTNTPVTKELILGVIAEAKNQGKEVFIVDDLNGSVIKSL